MKRSNSSVVQASRRHRLYLRDAARLADAGGMILTSAVEIAVRKWPPPITEPETLNTNAASDIGPDAYPRVTTGSQGDWVAVWYSQENLGGTIGTDWDILFSRSIDDGATWSAPAALNTNAASDGGPDGTHVQKPDVATEADRDEMGSVQRRRRHEPRSPTRIRSMGQLVDPLRSLMPQTMATPPSLNANHLVLTSFRHLCYRNFIALGMATAGAAPERGSERHLCSHRAWTGAAASHLSYPRRRSTFVRCAACWCCDTRELEDSLPYRSRGC